MIRHRHGDKFLLFHQDDHARLSGTLAAHIGNLRFARPDPFEPVVQAIAMHDSGWPMHDQQPTLNSEGLPLHVFETPVEISTRVWTESVRLAMDQDPYSGLLVSLHVMALSALAQNHYAHPADRVKHARPLFELNKFQQNQIEIQESLRLKLGLRNDLPLQYGLAPLNTSQADDLLLFNYQLLKAMDRVSLALLCSEQPFGSIDAVHPRSGEAPIELRLYCVGEWKVRIDPWPFELSRIEANVPYRTVPARAYRSLEELRRVYQETPQQFMRVQVVQRP